MKILILGGVKSGKSRLALEMAKQFPSPRLFVGTAEPFDEEMQEKIWRHQAERGPEWETLEEPLDLNKALTKVPDYGVCLIDCLTVWLGNLWHYQLDLEKEIETFCQALATTSGNLILVSNEIGLGPLPGKMAVRKYTEALGQLNQRVASMCDRVYLVVAGLVLSLKS